MKPERKKIVTRGVEEEPSVGHAEIPVIFFAILAGLVFVGLLYLDKFAGGFNNQVYRPFDSYNEVRRKQPADATARARAEGQRIYAEACQICHQANGLGTPGQFPPLDGSEWVTGPVGRLARIPLHGLAGPITVKGEPWNAAMPAVGASYDDEQIANLLTFIRSAWSNKASPVKAEQVKSARDAEPNRATPMTAEELLRIQD